jgi:catechol 2,3-dioxygenase-like lactoylglutathione lyase family enzyme
VLGDRDAVATVAVKDLEAAKAFYVGKLGLAQVGPEDPEAVFYKSGNSGLMVYRSQFAGTNQATAVTWSVGNDLEAIVRDLKSKGIAFEHYDMPETTREGDIHVSGDIRVAWFKDPDGNIHSLMNQ